MLFRWFATKEVDAFAAVIAADLLARFPPVEIEDPKRKGPLRLKKAHDAIFAQAEIFVAANSLNIFQKARLGSQFKDKLQEAGYSSAFIDSLTLELTTFVTTRSRTRNARPTLVIPDDPNQIQALSIATRLHNSGNLTEAEAAYQQILKKDSQNFEALYRLGILRNQLGSHERASELLGRAIAVNPRHPDALSRLGKVYLGTNRLPEAMDCFTRAIELEPSFADAHNSLGIVYQLLENQSDALASFRKAVMFGGNSAGAHTNLGMTLLKLGKSDEAISTLRHAVKLDPKLVVAHNNYLFCLTHDEKSKPEKVFSEHRIFGEKFEAPIRAQWPRHNNNTDPDRKLRVGFVSADLYAHPVANFVEPIWSALDKGKIEVVVYSSHSVEDTVTSRLKKLASQWYTVFAMDDDELAQKILDDRIDILFDLAGHTANNRLLVFARKPAPIQVSWIGNPNTTGLTAMDYYLADPYSAPPGMLDALFTEKIVQLPSGPLFQPFAASPPVSTLPALASGVITFGSFARSDKVTDGVIALWSRILGAVPGSRMLLAGFSDPIRNLSIVKQFARHGVDENRFGFHPRADMKTYLALHDQVDMILDTFPFSGGTTSCHAVWMGVPVVTLAGKTLSSRSGAIVNGNIGLTEFTTESADEFVQRAVEWSRKLPELAELRAGLRARTAASPMCQPQKVARWLESALRTIWHRWCDGKPAQSFAVNADAYRTDPLHNT